MKKILTIILSIVGLVAVGTLINNKMTGKKLLAPKESDL